MVERVGIIHEGKLLQERSRQDIEDSLDRLVEIKSSDAASIYSFLQDKAYTCKILDDNTLAVRGNNSQTDSKALIELLVEAGLTPEQVVLKTTELEDYFLKTINER